MNTKGGKFILGIILSHLLWISVSAQVSFGFLQINGKKRFFFILKGFITGVRSM